jgi:hypothetical protein
MNKRRETPMLRAGGFVVAEAAARAVNAEPWEPPPGMIKRRCPKCRYWFASTTGTAFVPTAARSCRPGEGGQLDPENPNCRGKQVMLLANLLGDNPYGRVPRRGTI